MGLSSSLNAGVSGLSVNASRLSALSDNIANSATYGYKRANVDFASVVTGQAAGQYDAGGVRSTSFREVSSRGSLVTTTNSTDIAIVGRGLLPVTPVTSRDDPAPIRPLHMTSTGSFTADDEGYLVSQSGLQLLGWPTDPSGSIGSVIRASGADLQPVKISGFDFASNPTSAMELGLNLPSGSSGTAGNIYSTGIEYYDALGSAQSMRLTFTSTANPNEWVMTFADSADGTVDATTDSWTLTFNQIAGVGIEAGSMATIAPTTAPAAGPPVVAGTQQNTTWDATTGLLTYAAPHGNISVNLGTLNSVGNLTQFDSGFAPVGITKDGTPVGGLSRVEVTEQGQLEAVYDTGFRQTIYQIPVADVPNLNGLVALDNQSFAVSSSSGPIYLWNPGEGPAGTMTGYSLEQSASDIADELTQLIETQRAYSSNAKIVQTVDEMLQETTNLKR